MFNISFLVSDNKLPDTLTRLHDIVQTVNVTHVGVSLNGVEQTVPIQTVAVAKPKKVNVKRHYRKRPAGPEGNQDQRALALIGQYGSAPWTAASFLRQTDKAGINKAAAYRGLRMAIDAGDLKRLESGVYQRTGQGINQSLNQQQA